MFRHSSHTVALGFAGLGLVGALAGCAAPASTDAGTGTGNDTGSTDSGATGSGTYKDGDYSADGSYTAPSGTETVTVDLTLKDNMVTALKVTGHATGGTQKGYQDMFVSGIKDVVVGKKLDDLASVTRVAGSSLTSGGFKKAIDEIKSDAAG